MDDIDMMDDGEIDEIIHQLNNTISWLQLPDNDVSVYPNRGEIVRLIDLINPHLRRRIMENHILPLIPRVNGGPACRRLLVDTFQLVEQMLNECRDGNLQSLRDNAMQLETYISSIHGCRQAVANPRPNIPIIHPPPPLRIDDDDINNGLIL